MVVVSRLISIFICVVTYLAIGKVLINYAHNNWKWFPGTMRMMRKEEDYTFIAFVWLFWPIPFIVIPIGKSAPILLRFLWRTE